MSRERLVALDRMVAALRLSETANDQMDEAFIALLGINHTDGHCLDIIQRLGQITAGELAQNSGLTTGAVTAVIDRLERAGYVERIRDPADRRKVFVGLTDLSRSLVAIVYGHIGELSGEGMGRMSPEDMDLIARFHRTSARLSFLLAEFMRDYVDGKARDPVERLRVAKNFAARIARERPALVAEMKSAWHDPPPDLPSGQVGLVPKPGERTD